MKAVGVYAAAVVLSLWAASESSASPITPPTLVSANDSVFGAGSITIDRRTGLAWLDPSLTVNRSFDEVLSQLGIGGEFFGFRYATSNEVAVLFAHAGFRDINATNYPNGFSPNNLQAAIAFLALVGSTCCTGGASFVDAQTSDGPGVGQHWRPTVQLDGNGAAAVWLPPFHSGTSTEYGANQGSWLVRTQRVPEPSTLLLLTTGIAGLLMRRRRFLR